MKGFRVGIDSYCLKPLKLSPLDLLELVAMRAGQGGQFSEGDLVVGGEVDEGLHLEISDTALSRGLNLELGGVPLAIELHFEFTTFELLRLIDMCDVEPGGWLAKCLDNFNMLPMLEDPVAGTERVLPWIVATHMKDGGVSTGPEGLSPRRYGENS